MFKNFPNLSPYLLLEASVFCNKVFEALRWMDLQVYYVLHWIKPNSFKKATERIEWMQDSFLKEMCVYRYKDRYVFT